MQSFKSLALKNTDFLVRLEFELKLEPLLLYSPAPAPAATAATAAALC